MAINRQDYQYIRNTIPGQQNKISDGTLEVGVTVKNLVPELSDKNVFNPNYPEFYGTKDPTKVWSCPLNGATGQMYEYRASDCVEKTETRQSQLTIRGKTGTIAELVGTTESGITIRMFVASFSEFAPEGTISVKSPSTMVKIDSYDSSTRKVTGRIYSTKANASVYSILECEIQYKTYSKQVETSFLALGLPVAGAKITSIEGGHLVSDSATHENIGTDINVSFTLSGASPTLWTKIYYEIESDFTIADTIKDGLLLIQLQLESGTSYVVQVIDAIAPKNEDLPDNHMIMSDDVDFTFDQYLFFRTPEDNPETKEKDIYHFELRVYGASFGYKLYHLDNEQGKLIQLRNFISPVGAKVFVFKSDLPWVVNNKGVIVGLSNNKLNIPASTDNTGQDASLSEDEIIEAFSKNPPLLEVNEDKLRIYLPDADSTTEKWRFQDMWNATRGMTNPPSIIQNVKLFVYRDYLKEDTIRCYNDQFISTRYGLIQTLQRNNKSDGDTYSPIDINQQEGRVLKIKILPISIEDNDSPFIELEFENNTDWTIDPSQNWVFSLPLLSLFGYNYQYCERAGYFNSTSIDASQYTSVCFAWGYESVDSNGKKKRITLSDFSEPVLIDRSLVNVEWGESGEYILSLGNSVLHRAYNPYYTDAIYLDKVEETIKIE